MSSSSPLESGPSVLPHKFNKLQKEKLSYQNLNESLTDQDVGGQSPTSTTDGEINHRKKRKTTSGKNKKLKSTENKVIDGVEDSTQPQPVDEQDKAAMHLLLHFRDANSHDPNVSDPSKALESTTTAMDNTNTNGLANPLFPFPQYLGAVNPLFGAQATTNPLANLTLLNFPATFAPTSILDPTGSLPTPTSSGTKRKFEGDLPGEVALHSDNNPVMAPPVRKDEVNILQFYEPRFYQVFHEYQKYIQEASTNGSVSVSTTIRDHLLALCLDHMIPFCCWARENPTITQWIKQTLEDNADLRPEVRNGISMILMYCFSAAQAKLRKDCDMFIALQDTETGLGIVNKTSLKIYNDPYQYFNFIKSCITGLIDAGRIPENERINKPKKSKLQAQSTEELEAFYEIKKIIIEKLSHGETDFVREKVQQISNLWYRRQVIRLKRFTTALTLLQTPLELPAHRIGNIMMETALPGEVDLSKIIAYSSAAMALPTTVGGLTGHQTESTNNATENPSEEDEDDTDTHRKPIPAELVKSASLRLLQQQQQLQNHTQVQSMDQGDLDQCRSVSTMDESTIVNRDTDTSKITVPISKNGTENSTTAAAAAATVTVPPTAAMGGNGLTGMIAPNGMSILTAPPNLPFFPYPFSPYPFINKASMEAAQLASPNARASRMNYAIPVAAPNNGTTPGVAYPNLPYFPYYPFRPSNPATAMTPAANPSLDNVMSAAAVAQAMMNPNNATNPAMAAANATTNTSSAPPGASITAYRFDRISLKQWKINEMKIFNVQYFLYDYPGVFYLVNERYLPESERQNLQTFHAEGTGMISLMHEFMAKDALITSWQKRDHPHLYNLLELWLASNQEVSLLDLWYQSQSQGEVTSGGGGGSNDDGPISTTSESILPEVRNRGRSCSSANNSNLNELPYLGRGYLIYEQSLQIGLVIRKNESLGLTEDCWRMIYLSDLEELASEHTTFDSFLLAFFPQLIPIFTPPVLTNEESQPMHSETVSGEIPQPPTDVSEENTTTTQPHTKRVTITPEQILIKYCSHHFDVNTVGPPPMEKDGAYQTLGLLTESTETIFSRFTPDYVFHDLILHYYL